MVEISAPAKINLSLRVVDKRADGFHEIDTIMAPLAFADTLTLERGPGNGILFSCDDPTLPAGDTNLVVRAIAAFRARAGLNEGVVATLQKRIPHGAGLGGGSSDAAAALLAMDKLFGVGLGKDVLAEVAAGLGSDVPFFLLQSAARCRGRGEIVEPAEAPRGLGLLLVKPPFAVPTPWAYSRWADSRELPGIPYGPQTFPWGELVNDLERPVFAKFLLLARIKSWLLAQPGIGGALMSGSGSTLFAIPRDAAEIAPLAGRLRDEFGDTLWLHTTTIA